MTTPTKQIRGIRQSIKAGSVLGRKSVGVGAVEEISANDLAVALINTGQIVSVGGSNPQQWMAGKVDTVGSGLMVVNETITANAASGGGVLPLVNGDPLAEIAMSTPGSRNPANAILVIAGGRVPYDCLFTTPDIEPIFNGPQPRRLPTGPGIIADPYGQMIGVPL